ncbi:MAG TPA: glutamate--tRNA ligase [Kiritimatiellia bacterium]|jgi:glutamyl-tRNA synthetase|nr:glutamate--tRNA ligase [Kiritimatiellia bacterium]MBP9571626.1 glutamate--tRNA ligase [Kiritimatiellia bacterium]HQF20492.1 glutamate--tRNA ligase [Kiritimatiellia bacterium]HQG74358.1 glutamate--tRNA ligase [Kiritimatiellia bacterium]HXK79160.1 glutamate--tRNA ligase [Kiritimatiellia bacterium]
MTIRTRFAPSPTGNVHIGNIRAAIYNWLFSRHAGGEFLLRIEDTDLERSTPAAVQTVLDSLAWLGLTYDGEPLYQSTQRARHLEVAEMLLTKGAAYKSDKGGTGKGEAIVFKMPGTDISFRDLVKGEITKKAEDLKDFVIVRSDGSPVFHLGNVVDDITMGITHVIRGDDHVENTFKHVAMYAAIGAPMPQFAHLPMIVNAQGKPYSKRDGAAYVGEFQDKGFLPEALFNSLALLGWSPGDDREVLTRDEMIAAFTLDRVRQAPSQLDMTKLLWMNGQHLKRRGVEDLVAGCRAAMQRQGLWREDIDPAYFQAVIMCMGERIRLYSDLGEQAAFFFTEEYPYDEKSVRKRLLKEGALAILREELEVLVALPEPFTAEATDAALHSLAEQTGRQMGDLVHPVRVAVSGTGVGPGLFEMLAVLGKSRVVARIRRTLALYGG